MPRGKHLDVSEQRLIAEFRKRGDSIGKIATAIGRSKDVVFNYLKSPREYGTKKRCGRKPIISKRLQKQIFKKATEENMNSSEIKADMCLSVSTRHIRRIISKDGRAKYRKMLLKPGLKPHHIESRLKWAHDHVDFGEKWKIVVFSDEKKFNLDGPDGFKFYWHDLSKEPKTCMSRNFRGGGLMVWGGFSYAGKLRLRFISNRMNSSDYIEMLEPVIDEIESSVGPDFIFQQDNAAIHVSKKSKEWFTSKDIPLLPWPACSPDLNPIENLWGIVSRDVYRNGRQFKTVQELKMQVLQSWMNIRLDVLRKLIISMKDRILNVIVKKGSN